VTLVEAKHVKLALVPTRDDDELTVLVQLEALRVSSAGLSARTRICLHGPVLRSTTSVSCFPVKSFVSPSLSRLHTHLLTSAFWEVWNRLVGELDFWLGLDGLGKSTKS
jgi:hypothetical protein